MLSTLNNCYGIFLTNQQILWHLKSKKKNYFDETVFQTILFNEKIRITAVFLWIKDPDPGDPKKGRIRPDPDPD